MHLLAVAENIFFLVLVAAIGLIRWIMAASETAKNSRTQKRTDPPAANAPVPRAPAQTEEERVRRFMEALGVPSTGAPPPKTQPRRVTPKIPRSPGRTISPVDPFPSPRRTLWAPEPVIVTPPALPSSTSAIPTATPPPVRVAAAQELLPPVFEVYAIDGRTAGPTTTAALVRQEADVPPLSWAARLTSPSSLRDAIILREIFGPPRSAHIFEHETFA